MLRTISCHFILPILHKNKEHLALRNNFRVTKKFLITKFDCTSFLPFCHDEFATTVFVATCRAWICNCSNRPYFEHITTLTYSLCKLCCNSTHVWEKDMEVKISKFILEHPLISMASDMCAFTMDIESYQNTFVQIRDQKIAYSKVSIIRPGPSRLLEFEKR